MRAGEGWSVRAGIRAVEGWSVRGGMRGGVEREGTGVGGVEREGRHEGRGGGWTMR